ncbi:hypothetical protein Tco_0578629 [Tanacetum coccineum]
MLEPPVLEGEGSRQPTKPQPAPSTTQPIIKEQIPITESSSPQNTQTPRQALQEDTQLPQTSVPIPNVANEVKKKVKRLEKKQRARTPRMKLFKIGTSKRKSDLNELDDINNMVDDAMKNVEGDVETHGRNSDKTEELNLINTASIDISAADPSTSTSRDIFKDEMMTIADTLMAIRSTRPRITSVVICDVEEEPRRATPVPTVQSQNKGKGKMVEPEHTPKKLIKAQIQRDAKIAQRLFEEEQTQFERERAKDYALLAARLQEIEREQFAIDEKARFLVETIAERKEILKLYEREQKWINDFVPMDSKEGGKKADNSKKEAASGKKRQKADPDDENVKRQKLEDATEKEGLKAYLKIIPDEDRAVNYETLATKYPIVD